MSGEREVGSKGQIKKMEKHANAQLEGRRHGYSLHPGKELCWLVLGMIPSHILRLDGHVAFRSRTGLGAT